MAEIGARGGELLVWTYRRIMRDYLPADCDSWAEAWRGFTGSGASTHQELAVDLDDNGIEEPLLLGPDGRLLDGRFRLWWAYNRDSDLVPVEVMPPAQPAP